MRNFDNVKMVLFDSTNASFKLAVEASFSRRNQDGTYRDLVYVSSYNANLNPNIYLTFSYKSADTQQDAPRAVYMSYPQLFRLRETMKKVADLVSDGSGFSSVKDSNGVEKTVVKPGCDKPINITGIGKGNNWISFKLVTVENTENGVTNVIPAVSLGLSTSHPSVSVLTVEEFLTVYTIVNDLDLASLQCNMSLAFLAIDRNGGQANSAQYAYAPTPAYAPQPNYPQPAPVQGYYQQPRQGQVQPRYNNGGYRPNNRNAQAVQRAATPVPPAPEADEPVAMAPRQQTSSQLPLRENKPVSSLKDAVQDTPISEVDYNDMMGIDSIFDD